jgi:hypothetical protein
MRSSGAARKRRGHGAVLGDPVDRDDQVEEEGVDGVLVHLKAVPGERLLYDPFQLGDVV